MVPGHVVGQQPSQDCALDLDDWETLPDLEGVQFPHFAVKEMLRFTQDQTVRTGLGFVFFVFVVFGNISLK